MSAPRPDIPDLPWLDRPETFAAPWEAKAFALVVTLHEAGLFGWREFADRLSAEIHANPDEAYYRCWFAAAVRLLAEKAIIDPRVLAVQAQAVAAFRRADHQHVARTGPIAVAPGRPEAPPP
ncbi:nitrile hydratase accessory protein [Ancylobacter lacus]|uniref:nitrile hydratase accessory protein n=1 Tax=Ancylobacter lacus TaxID=2579970 RepID=UPI001BCF9349|nr:nitrile hydratase accessory protein [Ancylobacter lacus]MBS7537799.1 nitrile hydratase accessory protein [Ancylobacter lacus]